MTSSTYARLFKKATSILSDVQKQDIPKPQHTVVAVLSQGKAAIGAPNSMKTHPDMFSISKGKKQHVHAEVALLSQFKGQDIKGPMLVVRENIHGLAMARPCHYCENYIRTYFPDLEVYYSTQTGAIARLRSTR